MRLPACQDCYNSLSMQYPVDQSEVREKIGSLYTSPLSSCLANNAADIYDLIISFREISTLNNYNRLLAFSERRNLDYLGPGRQLRARQGQVIIIEFQLKLSIRIEILSLVESVSINHFLPLSDQTSLFFFLLATRRAEPSPAKSVLELREQIWTDIH